MRIIAWVVAFCSMSIVLVGYITTISASQTCYVVPVLDVCVPVSTLLIPVLSIAYVLSLAALFPIPKGKLRLPKKVFPVEST